MSGCGIKSVFFILSLFRNQFLEAENKNQPYHTMLNKPNTNRGFTIVEIMIIIAMVMLLTAIAVPNYMRSKKHSQAKQIIEEMQIVDRAIDEYAIDKGVRNGEPISWDKIRPYIGKEASARLYRDGTDALGNPILLPKVGEIPKVNPSTIGALSVAVSTDFWSPYN